MAAASSASSRLRGIDLTPFSADPSRKEDGLVAEISASFYEPSTKRLTTITTGGSERLTVSSWKQGSNPSYRSQLKLTGAVATSVAARSNTPLIAVATTPSTYSETGLGNSSVSYYTVNGQGKLVSSGASTTGFLSDAVRFSDNNQHLFTANEGQPNTDYSVDPAGSVSIIALNANSPSQSKVETIQLPEPNTKTLKVLGSALRFSGKTGITTRFEQDAEPEYLSQAGRHLFVTLQENNAVARINLDTNKVEAYIGLGSVDYSRVSIDLDDKDNGFQPKSNQRVRGLRMPDGIVSWQQGKSSYFITANEGDSREYGDEENASKGGYYLDEIRNGDLSTHFSSVPKRLKLINDGNAAGGATRPLIISDRKQIDPTEDLVFGDAKATPSATPLSFGSRSLSLFDGITGKLLWDSWQADQIKGKAYNTSLQNIAQFAKVYDDGRSDDKGVEAETVALVQHQGRRYVVGAMERTSAGDKPDEITQGGLLVVYDVTNINNVDFVTYQKVSRSPEGIEVVPANQSPSGRVLLGVSSEYNSNTVEFFDFPAILANGNGGAFLKSDFARVDLYPTL